jgi:hypothetical protein
VTRKAKRILEEKLLEKQPLEDREEDRRKTLIWILGKEVVRMDVGAGSGLYLFGTKT